MPLAVTVRLARQAKLVGGIRTGDNRQKADHVNEVKLTVSASRGTLAGDLLWLATIAIVFAVITGMDAGLDVYGYRDGEKPAAAKP